MIYSLRVHCGVLSLASSTVTVRLVTEQLSLEQSCEMETSHEGHMVVT